MWKPASFALAIGLCAVQPAFADHPKPASGEAHGHAQGHAQGHGDAGHMALAKAKVGEIMVMNPMIRATPPNAPAAGGFLTLHNMGQTDDTLIAARIAPDVASRVELHTMEMDGDVMRMFEVEGGIPVPAGEIVQLMPGGLHVMFMGLATGLSEGGSHEVTLVFEAAGEVTLPFAVLPLGMIREMTGTGGGTGGGHGHGHSGH